MAEARRRSSISQAGSVEDIGEFWDSHDFTDYDDPNAPDISFDIHCAVPVEPRIV